MTRTCAVVASSLVTAGLLAVGGCASSTVRKGMRLV